MPIQWNSGFWQQYSPQYVLAGVLQGESNSYAGQLAVANVMANRLYSGNFGANIENVVTPGNFNGFQPPTPQSLGLANALMEGTLPASSVGPNALYFAAAGAGGPLRALGAGQTAAPNVGGNYFSDQYGAPSQDYLSGFPYGSDQPQISPGGLPNNPLFSQNMQMPDVSGGIAPQDNGGDQFGDNPFPEGAPANWAAETYGPNLPPGTQLGSEPYGPNLPNTTETGAYPDSTPLPEVTVDRGPDWQASSGVATSTAGVTTGGATGSWDTAPAQTDQADGGSDSVGVSNLPGIMAGQQGYNPLAGVDVSGGAAQDTTAPAQTDNLPLMASGGASPELQAAGLGQNVANTPGWGQGLNAPGSGSFPPPVDTSTATDTGVQTGTYNGQSYTYATPGGPQTAQYYQGPDANAQTAPAQTQQDTGASSQAGSDNLPLMASGATGAQQAAGLQDQSALSSDGATSGLPGPLKQILGGQAPGSDAQAPSAKGEDSSGGAPVDITDISGAGAKGLEAASKAITGAGKTVGQSAQQLGQVAAQDTQSLVQAASKADQQAADIAQTSLSHLSNLFQRGMVAFMGLVLIGGAVYYFSKHQGTAS